MNTSTSKSRIIDIIIGKPHMLVKIVRASNTFFVASRGAHKTTRVGSLYLHDCVTAMPGTFGCLVGPTFAHLEQNTLNPLFNALKEFGYNEGEHYVARQKPPAHFDKPLVEIITKNYDHLYSFYNGTTLVQISMERSGSANGLTLQFGLFDETKLYNELELADSVYKAFRGTSIVNNLYGKNSLFLSKMHLTDKLTTPDKINWILEKEKLNDWDKINVVIQLALLLDKAQKDYIAAGVNRKKNLSISIALLEDRLNKLRRDMVLYVEANHTDVIKVLGKEDGNIWFNNQKRDSKPYHFDVSILNKNPTKPDDGFYPDFSIGTHVIGYEAYDTSKELIIAADYQHSVSPICVCQLNELPADASRITNSKKRISLNYIDAIYTLAPKGLKEAVELFCKRYENHSYKRIKYVIDATATGKRNNADRFYEIVVNVLKHNKWHVEVIHTGKQPGHYQKWTDTKAWLLNKDGDNMDITVHADCVKLIKSIQGAPAKTIKRGNETITVKDKKFEDTTKYPNLCQSETTHFSDVFDMINHAVLKLELIKVTITQAGGFSTR
jgi:hypothetical protein